jgi:RNA methyltransferase, TrmH family
VSFAQPRADLAAASFISSADNPLIKELRKLGASATAYRKQGRVWLEGEHLCEAALAAGVQPALAVFKQSFVPAAQQIYAAAAIKNIVVADALWGQISSLESPAGMGFVCAVPGVPSLLPNQASVVLDRVQDAGNVGSILRSAAAFGFTQIIALSGCAALWSPKVIRAAMGAHFSLQLHEAMDVDALDGLTVALAVTSLHQGEDVQQLSQAGRLPRPCAWVFGHEGQGVSDALLARAKVQVRIRQPGGQESLNVAAAAAICLYASA